MKAQSTSRGFVSLSIANLFSKVLSLAYVPMILAILTDTGHGIYAFSYEIYVFAYIVLTEGFAKGITKLVAEYGSKNEEDGVKATFNESLKIMGVLGAVVGLIIFLLAKPISSLGGSPEAYLAIRALAPCLFLTCILSVFRGYFQGRMYMKAYAISQIVEQIANVFFSLLFAYFLMKKSMVLGIFGGAFGTTVGALVSIIYLYYMFRRYDDTHNMDYSKVSIDVRHKVVNFLKKYSVPLTLGTLLQQSGNLVDVFNVKNRLLTSGLTEVSANKMFSYLSTFKTMINVPLSIVIALSMAMLPAISRLYAKNEYREIGRQYNMCLKVALLLIIPSSFGLSATSFSITGALFDGQAVRALLMMVGAFNGILMAISIIQTIVLQATGSYRQSNNALICGIFIKIVLNFLLVGIPSIGIYGAVISSYLSYSIIIVINEYLLRRDLKVKTRVSNYLFSTILASVVMETAIIITHIAFFSETAGKPVNAILLLFQLFIGIAVFAVLSIKLGAINKRDISAVSEKLLNKIPASILRHISD